MTRTLHLETIILPGNRLEICNPDLPVGSVVEVTVTVLEKPIPRRTPIAEFLISLPVGPRVFSTWEEYEQQLRDEKGSWEQ